MSHFSKDTFQIIFVMPGVLITEALAQTGVAMLNSEENKGKIALFLWY